MKYCTKAGTNIYSLTWELTQESKIINDYKNNIVIQSTKGNFSLDHWVKTCNGQVARVKFKTDPIRAQ